ncbi:coiled-coil domain-containing protein [Cnuibacter sp. UC19_7]|uniref:coiled-coil domain-containing protein n=1 Tax=Cnuibacter sp. UC19_7 TaxID=3350166 RepID=UPI00366E1941
MRARVARLGVAAAVAAALVASPFAAAGAVQPSAPRADYPSWDEVQAAKANEATKQAEVDNITSLISGLESQTAQLQQEAFARGQEYLKAQADLQSATSLADSLQTQATAAAAKAAQAKQQVGQLVSHLYRQGGDSTMTLFLDGSAGSDDLLYQLGTMSQLTQTTTGIRDAAVAAENTSQALTEQASVAETERSQLADEASTRLQSAQAAQVAAESKLAEAQATSNTLYEQLATLKDTTAQTEKDYQQGVADAQAAAAAAAAAGGYDDDPGSAWVPGSDSIMSPSQAQAYAASQMGAWGWGGDQFSCLVSLWTGESGWRANALNESSGAYGIPQSLPATKMATAGADWQTNAATQINWGLSYISRAYGTPCSAWSKWQSRSPHWY